MTPGYPNVRTPGRFVGKAVHFKILALCFVCTFVYVYLYSEVSRQALAIQELMKGVFDYFIFWGKEIRHWWNLIRTAGLIKNVELTERERNITRNYAETFVPRVVFPSEFNFSNYRNNLTYIEKLSRNIIKANKTLLTLFTTWQTTVEKYVCHNNTIRNWNQLKPFVQPILFSDEEDLSVRVAEMGWKVLPVSKTGKGVPVLKNMYLDVVKVSKSIFYAYANGDILFTDTLIITLMALLNSSVNKSQPLMVIGRRTNVENVTSSDAVNQSTIHKIAESRGSLFSVWGEDYFITMKNYPWKNIPEVIIGRRAYDNWLVLDARKRGNVIDATETLLAVHQTTYRGNYEGHKHRDKDYNHNLLVRTFRRLHYAAGKTSCAELFTKYNITQVPEIHRRKIDKECFPL
ncbi:uncharacterized protein LOC133204956 [Saccostrea echinata]|uniref:uncharacterized protein LOC133204956 n=1 Tax=Saccostrea echinata TaxID=191078 RepID=UPI002A824DFA|nr:uncharacterized protein LOC133204956 [Saccostrea echinata]